MENKDISFIHFVMKDVDYYMNTMGDMKGKTYITTENEHYVFKTINPVGKENYYVLAKSFEQLMKLRDRLEEAYNKSQHIAMTLRRQ